MKIERQIEEMAKLSGATKFDSFSGIVSCVIGGSWVTIPDYHNDMNAVQRVIDGMDDILLRIVGYHLESICGTIMHPWILLLKATPSQKCEAILKAYGKWESE